MLVFSSENRILGSVFLFFSFFMDQKARIQQIFAMEERYTQIEHSFLALQVAFEAWRGLIPQFKQLMDYYMRYLAKMLSISCIMIKGRLHLICCVRQLRS